MYCGHMGVEHPENWNFYLAFAFFRQAVMLQGHHHGSLAGEEPPGQLCPAQGTARGTELPPCSSTGLFLPAVCAVGSFLSWEN